MAKAKQLAIEYRLEAIRIFIKNRRLKVLQRVWRKRAAKREAACKQLQKTMRGCRARWMFAGALTKMKSELVGIRAEKQVQNKQMCDMQMGELRAVLAYSKLWPDDKPGYHPIDEQTIFAKVACTSSNHHLSERVGCGTRYLSSIRVSSGSFSSSIQWN